jgi:hypothetical protein
VGVFWFFLAARRAALEKWDNLCGWDARGGWWAKARFRAGGGRPAFDFGGGPKSHIPEKGSLLAHQHVPHIPVKLILRTLRGALCRKGSLPTSSSAQTALQGIFSKLKYPE